MDTTLATFENDVIEASRQLPVLVDFWASWCAPCKTLGPMLEKLESEYANSWKLVKVDSEANPELSAHFQVRSIPFVVAFVDGQPVDKFVGALPESELRAFIDRLLPDQGETERRAAAAAREEGRNAQAYDHLQAALALDPGYDDARLDMIEMLLADDKLADAQREAGLLSPKTTQGIDARFNAIKTRLDASAAVSELPPADALEQRIAANPADLDARFDLASRLIATGQYGDALDQLLAITVRDRQYREDIGRKTMLSVFELAADQPALVSQWRRKLSAALN
jgi:putative thioredoxin